MEIKPNQTQKHFSIFIYTAVSLFFAALLFPCCKNTENKAGLTGKEILAVTYNAQTFFDSVTAGTEFKEFRGSRWTDELYRKRLKRLAETLASVKTADKNRGKSSRNFFTSLYEIFSYGNVSKKDFPDIIVLQEIENVEVIKDLCAFFPVQDIYSHIVFIPAGQGSAFSTAVLSVFPVEVAKAHDFSNSSRLKHKTPLRPLTEVVLNMGDSQLVLFAVHWKSKGGSKLPDGNRETRKEQENTLFCRIQRLENEKPGTPFIVCGDFNQQPAEFSLMNEYDSAWDFLPEQSGTYCFRGEWEKIDNFFVSEHFREDLSSGENYFYIADNPGLLKSDGSPSGFRIHTGQGYSDHLPLAFRFVLP